MNSSQSVIEQIKEVIYSVTVSAKLTQGALRAVARFERVPWLPDKMRLALNQYYVPPFLLSPDGRVSRSNIDEELMIINIPMVLDTYYLLVDPPQGNLYSIDQAAAYLNMEPQSIQDALAHQELPLAHQDGEQARIAQSDLDQFRRKHLLIGVR
jgi:excisionase family DNA binding protein